MGIVDHPYKAKKRKIYEREESKSNILGNYYLDRSNAKIE